MLISLAELGQNRTRERIKVGAQDDMMDLAELRTKKFTPFLPDDSQVNPGVYGAELAYWLAQQLASRGVITSYPESEDWGWYLNYTGRDGAEFAIHCGNVFGEDDLWLLSLRRYSRKMFGRDKPSFEKASVLINAIRDVLSNAGIATLDWRAGVLG
ncbi:MULTISPECIES: hypothetical protein [unclassified Duganella]|uniref:hypothetical protein n=1 Tax=unclassified Duganella TaxID=2636909 RepID=UPI0018F788D8|nr:MULTISPECIES: hypothetical protein [unclassified Duganella]